MYAAYFFVTVSKVFLRDTHELQTNLTAGCTLNTPVVLPRVSSQQIRRHWW